jgi:hypothetical protein
MGKFELNLQQRCCDKPKCSLFYRMMMMTTTMTMMIEVQEQIRTQFFWDM